MSAALRPRLLDVCEPQVIAFHCTFQGQGYALRADLEWLDELHRQAAVVGTILHASRILEALAREAAGPGGNLHSNINYLQHYHQMPRRLRNALHELRRLGNIARHALRPLSPPEGEIAFILAVHWLAWYFCDYGQGLRLRNLLVHNQPLESLLPADLAGLMRQLLGEGLNDLAFLDSLALNDPNCQVLLSPILPALLVEGLLEREHYEASYRLLTAASTRFNRDLRLRQLRGLYHSSRGELDQARQLLESAPRTGTAVDEETLGILAGVYKRYWEADPRNTGRLTQAQQTYLAGWERSGRTNAYLGINAATTALWLGQAGQARALAVPVVGILEARRGQLAGLAGGPVVLNYWDEVTLAEGLLLLGRFGEAQAHYEAAFARHRDQTRSIHRTRGQARRVLEALGQGLADYPYLNDT